MHNMEQILLEIELNIAYILYNTGKYADSTKEHPVYCIIDLLHRFAYMSQPVRFHILFYAYMWSIAAECLIIDKCVLIV